MTPEQKAQKLQEYYGLIGQLLTKKELPTYAEFFTLCEQGLEDKVSEEIAKIQAVLVEENDPINKDFRKMREGYEIKRKTPKHVVDEEVI